MISVRCKNPGCAHAARTRNCVSVGAVPCLFTKAFRDAFFYGNHDPSQHDSLFTRLQSMQQYLVNYLACWKEQRLIVENDEFNKTIKAVGVEAHSPNATLPLVLLKEDDIVRYPAKVGGAV